MIELYERLIRYVKIDTQADENSDTVPSSKKQIDLAKVLKQEMIGMGMKDVILDEYGYLYGTIPANIEKEVPKIGFIAHMDTAPDFSGTNVNPRIIYNYDGNEIKLNENLKITKEEFPQFNNYIGNNIMVTDGKTLLGADDKAGIAAIMQAAKYLLTHLEIKHGEIRVGFSVDEEIGRGADNFNVDLFSCDFAYTLDGDEVSYIESENFNASGAKVIIKGKSIHPGSAKDKMVNAINLAMEFHSYLPVNMRPEHTEGREGFNHIHNISGDCEEVVIDYIIRNHDFNTYQKQLELFKEIQVFMNKKYGDNRVNVEIKESYKNMFEILKNHPYVVETAKKALKRINIEPKEKSIRGGTDGANLSFKGLPCPNLGTGGGNFHGPFEYCNLTQLEKAVELIINIAQIIGEEK